MSCSVCILVTITKNTSKRSISRFPCVCLRKKIDWYIDFLKLNVNVIISLNILGFSLYVVCVQVYVSVCMSCICFCFLLSLHSVVCEEDTWTARAAYQISCGQKVCSTQTSQQPYHTEWGITKLFTVPQYSPKMSAKNCIWMTEGIQQYLSTFWILLFKHSNMWLRFQWVFIQSW